MEDPDLEPRHKAVPKKDLTLLGISELETYIAGLEAEIARAQAEIAAKRRTRSGAESLFKK